MNIEFERINQSSQAIVDWSFIHKKEKEREYISLPVLDTPFLKALQVPLSMSKDQGVKIHAPLFESLSQLEVNPNLMFSEQAFDRLFEAVDIIKEKNPSQKIIYKMPNLLNIMEAVLPFDQLIRLTRKNPELYCYVMTQLINFMHKIIKRLDIGQVDVIYFFDSFGSYQLLGPNFYKKAYGEFVLALFSIEKQLKYTVLSMAKTISVPMHQSYGLIENKKSRIYLTNQDSKGTIKLTKAVSFNKKGVIPIDPEKTSKRSNDT